MTRLLLLSNSTNFGAGYLDHAMGPIIEFLAGVRRIAFVPFALQDHAKYTAKARARFANEGVALEAATPDAEGRSLLTSADAVFVGGGNTFRLLAALQRSGLLPILRARAQAGMPYLGASAGTNIAAPTLKTTNDMPILEPPSFEALGLIPFQINPHYVEPNPGSRHMGETRDDRLREYLEENQAPVLGLREGAWLLRDGPKLTLHGPAGARLFQRNVAPREIGPGTSLDDLLA